MPALDGSELTLLRTHPHKFKEYLAVLQPGTILACQLNGAPSGDPVTQINYDSVSQGSYSDVVVGMTLWVGTAAGKRDKGTCRVRKAPTSSILYIAEDSKIDWVDNDHLTVVENYEFWVKYPRVVANGGVAFYKDWEVAYSDQHSNWAPVAVLGPPDCQFIDSGSGLATCKFVGEHSYAVAPGASISTYSWTFPDGTPSSSSSQGTEASPISVTWDTPGIYWISLMVTDSNGKTHTGRRPVFIFERTGVNAPYTQFKMTGRSGSLNQHGHTASFEVHGDADQAEFPDRALVVYFTEDWYGETKQSIGGNFKYREHIKFVGYIQRESTIKDPETSAVTFEAATVNSLMATREGFSCWIKNKGSASNWTESTYLTADRAALSLCRYQSTILDICDVIPTGNTLYIESQEFAAKTSLIQQLQSLHDSLFAHVACDKQGRLYFELDPQMLAVADRSSIAIVADLQHGDWRERIDLPRPQEPKTSFINLGGVYYPGYPHEVDAILSKAPGDAPDYMGTTREINGLILVSQSDGNAKAGLALAYDNNEFPDVTLPMAGMWDVFDIVPREYVRLSLAAADTKRGIVWTNQKLIPHSISLRVDETETGRVALVDITVEKDSYGPAGVDGDYPDEVPSAGGPSIPPTIPEPPTPPGGELGDGNLLYFVDGTSGRVFRTRNARAANPANVVYEDLGVVDAGGLYEIILDPWDPKNSALVCGRYGAWLTRNLNDTMPVWDHVLELTDWEAVSAAASICQKNLWMIGTRAVAGGPGRWICVSDDGCASFDTHQISGEDGYIRVEWSSHVAQKGWATFITSGGHYVARTANAWTSWTNYNLSGCLGTPGGQLTMSNPHHRFFDNATDQHGLYGGYHSINDAASVCRCLVDPPGSCTTSYPGGTGGKQLVKWLESYTWGSTKYWALTYHIVDTTWQFYVSDDGVIWTYQYTFSQTGGNMFISGWPYNGERFYATQDGAVAPILISNDRGATWQAQTGNWAALGYTGDIRRCVPVWID